MDDAVQGKLAAQAPGRASPRRPSDQAQLNLDFTQVTSLIDGIAGLVRAQIGDLVGPGTGDPDDRVRHRPGQGASSRSASSPTLSPCWLKGFSESPERIGAGMEFDLILSDGTLYPKKGTFYAIDSQVDANTGTIRVAALASQPQRVLRAGQYAKVRAVVSVSKGALLAPQRALTELQGKLPARHGRFLEPRAHHHGDAGRAGRAPSRRRVRAAPRRPGGG